MLSIHIVILAHGPREGFLIIGTVGQDSLE